MAYEVYATSEDVSMFTGKSVDSLPSDINILIARASDLITNSIIVDIEERHKDALRLATCAQVEDWMSSGNNENSDQVQSYSAGKVSVTYKDNGMKRPICIRARGYLNKEGLLYRGVKLL